MISIYKKKTSAFSHQEIKAIFPPTGKTSNIFKVAEIGNFNLFAACGEAGAELFSNCNLITSAIWLSCH